MKAVATTVDENIIAFKETEHKLRMQMIIKEDVRAEERSKRDDARAEELHQLRLNSERKIYEARLHQAQQEARMSAVETAAQQATMMSSAQPAPTTTTISELDQYFTNY